jgi:hypothetical protein
MRTARISACRLALVQLYSQRAAIAMQDGLASFQQRYLLSSADFTLRDAVLACKFEA